MTEPKALQISSKLNPELDAELIERILKIPKRDRSRTYREALRFYFDFLDKNETSSLD